MNPKYPASGVSRWHRGPTPAADPEVELFPDYATTLASGIDDTLRNLKVIREFTYSGEEDRRLNDQALSQLRTEIQTLRDEHAKFLTTLKNKASKGQLEEFKKSLTELWTKKVDNLFKLVGVIGTAIGILVAIKGHM